MVLWLRTLPFIDPITLCGVKTSKRKLQFAPVSRTTNITSVFSIARWMPASWARPRTNSFTHIFYCITSDLSCLGVVCDQPNFKRLNLLQQTLKQSAVRKIRSKHLWKINTFSCKSAPLFKPEFLLKTSLSHGGDVQLFLQHWKKNRRSCNAQFEGPVSPSKNFIFKI